MNGSRVFWLVMYGFMTLTVVFTFFRFGPIVERIAMPVVTVHAEFQLLRQDGFTFILVGEKHRNCQLELFTAAWRFDSTSEVAPLYDATTGEIFTAPRTIEPGEDFTFGPLFVKFTPSSYSLAQPIEDLRLPSVRAGCRLKLARLAPREGPEDEAEWVAAKAGEVGNEVFGIVHWRGA